jgi:hypothetical protein
MHVAADVVRDGSAHGPALVFDLDDGQVERSEQQVDGAPDQRGVDLVAVAVQRHGRDRGDLALSRHRPPGAAAPSGRGGRAVGAW